MMAPKEMRVNKVPEPEGWITKPKILQLALQSIFPLLSNHYLVM